MRTACITIKKGVGEIEIAAKSGQHMFLFLIGEAAVVQFVFCSLSGETVKKWENNSVDHGPEALKSEN